MTDVASYHAAMPIVMTCSVKTMQAGGQLKSVAIGAINTICAAKDFARLVQFSFRNSLDQIPVGPQEPLVEPSTDENLRDSGM